MPELHSLHRLVAPSPGELFAVLSDLLPGLSRHQARRAIAAGLVKVAGSIATTPTLALVGGERIEADLGKGIRKAWLARRHGAVAPGVAPFKILFRDRHLVVVDKSAGLLSVPVHDGEPARRGTGADHVPGLLRKQWRAEGHEASFIGTVHRLDRDTSGCLCFALARPAQRLLAAQFAGTSAVRTYRCLVEGHPRQESGEVTGKQGRDDATGRRALVEDDEPGVVAITRWKVLRRFALGAELEVDLGTGRTHQIRVAMAHLGHPVFGDRVYNRRPSRPGTPHALRLMLHALTLELDHPATGERLKSLAPIPDEYAGFVRLLERGSPAGSAAAPAPRAEPARPRPERRPRH